MITIILVIIISLIFLLKFFPGKKCLPGPWNLPIIGYLHKLDSEAPYFTLTELAEKYGPVYRIKLGLMDVVVISDAKILKKVLTKNETVDRPPLFMLDTVFRGKGIVYTSGDLWKDQRKFVANFFRIVGGAKVSPNRKTCESLIRKRVEDFVKTVESQGDCAALNPSESVTHFVASTAGMLLLGKPFSSDDKTVSTLMHNFDKIVKLAAFGGPLNFLPFLRFLPQFKNALASLEEAVRLIREIESELLNECKKSISKSNIDSPTNLIEAFLLQMSKGGPQHIYNIEQLHYLLFDMFLAFSETTITSLLWILLYLAHYEEVQCKVRQELLEVLQDKTVEMDDVVNLHYTKAAIAEIGRIRSLIPLGIPHCPSEDICVEGFTIPKDSMIMPLVWAIHMDPNVYKLPEEFRPERFMDKDGHFFKTDSFIPFQNGKRICVGEEIANMVVSIFIANVLRNFIIKCDDSSPVDLTGICGATLTPKPHKLIFTKI